MRVPLRPPEDYRVDRSDVEVPRGMELTDTNRPMLVPTKVLRVHCAVPEIRSGARSERIVTDDISIVFRWP